MGVDAESSGTLWRCARGDKCPGVLRRKAAFGCAGVLGIAVDVLSWGSSVTLYFANILLRCTLRGSPGRTGEAKEVEVKES